MPQLPIPKPGQPSSEMCLSVGLATDTAHRFSDPPQTPNQDSGLAIQLPGGEAGLALACVCDGLGGEGRGEDASRAVVRSILKSISPSAGSARAIVECLGVDWLRSIHDEVRALASGVARPATTLTLAIAEGSRVWVASLGDSRIYHLRGGDWPAPGRVVPLVFDNLRDPAAFDEFNKDSGMDWCVGGPRDADPCDVWNWRDYEVRFGDVVICASDGTFDNFSPVLFDLFAAYAGLRAANGEQFAHALVDSVHRGRRMLRGDRLGDTGMRDDTTAAAICWGRPSPIGATLSVWHPAWGERLPLVADEVVSDMRTRLDRGAVPAPLLDEFLGPWCGVDAEAARSFRHYGQRRQHVGLGSLLAAGRPEEAVSAPLVVPRSMRSPIAPDRPDSDRPVAGATTGFWVRIPSTGATHVPPGNVGGIAIRLGSSVVLVDGGGELAKSEPLQSWQTAFARVASPDELGVGSLRLWVAGNGTTIAGLPAVALNDADPDGILAGLAAAAPGATAVLQAGDRWLTTVADGVQPMGRLVPGLAEVGPWGTGLHAVRSSDTWYVVDASTGLMWSTPTPDRYVRWGGVACRIPCEVSVDQAFFRLGRKGWPLQLAECDDPYVAPDHCQLYRADGAYWVCDLGSENGVWLWADPVVGDQVLLADHVVEWTPALSQAFQVGQPDGSGSVVPSAAAAACGKPEGRPE